MGERFRVNGGLVEDRASGLYWSQNANPAAWPLFWDEAREYLNGLNQEAHLGHHDWRLPNRRELFSLMDYAQANPALPPGHPFIEVQLAWYWTATTYAGNPAYAWYGHAEGGRLFYGDKGRSYYLWPVRGASPSLAATGAPGEALTGRAWPTPRWEAPRRDGLGPAQRAWSGPGGPTWAPAR